MAYANKYYDPVKAHEYYLRTRQLKGYANRYGGSRGGDGTPNATSKAIAQQTQSENTAHNELLKKKAEAIKSANSDKIDAINSQISSLKRSLDGMSSEDRAKYAKRINRQVDTLRRKILSIKDAQADALQNLSTQTKGGSQSGFNDKGKKAVKDLKAKLKEESAELTKKINKDIDDEMLSDVKRLYDDVKAMREKGLGMNRSRVLSRFNSFRKEASKAKNKHLTTTKREFLQRLKDEIDDLRKDETNFKYYDTKKIREKKRKEADAMRKIRYANQDRRDAERERKKREQEAERARKKAEREREKAEREAERARKKAEREAAKASKSVGSTKKKQSTGSTKKSSSKGSTGSTGSTGSFLSYYKVTRGRDYVGKYR